jgi:hypothetical protein
MPDVPDDTATRFSLLEFGDAPIADATPAPETPADVRPSLRPASYLREAHRLTCGMQVVVSMFTPRVYCGGCGEDLDPIDVLRKYATQERQFEYANEEAREKLGLLRREVEELTKIRNNLRAQVRRGNQRH